MATRSFPQAYDAISEALPEPSQHTSGGRVWTALQKRAALAPRDAAPLDEEQLAALTYERLERLHRTRRERHDLFERQAHALEGLLTGRAAE